MDSVLVKIIMGLIVGLVSGFFGSGGGMLLIPYLSKALSFDDKETRATSIFIIFILIIISSLFYINKKQYDLNVAFKCMIGGMIGAIIGSKLLEKLSSNILNIIFIVFLLFSGIKLIFY